MEGRRCCRRRGALLVATAMAGVVALFPWVRSTQASWTGRPSVAAAAPIVVVVVAVVQGVVAIESEGSGVEGRCCCWLFERWVVLHVTC